MCQLSVYERRSGAEVTFVYRDRGGQTMEIDDVREFDTTFNPNSDPIFTELHNTCAGLYQLFKDEVQLLLSGTVPETDHEAFFSHILQTASELLVAAEDEKTYLMNNVLCKWATKQQKVSIGTLYTQELVYEQLIAIDQQFEYFGELLEQTMTGLKFMSQSFFGQHGFDQMYNRYKQFVHHFLFYSIIVARQPPSVVVKSENHRRSRFWFNTEILMLGGRAFGIASGNNNKVQSDVKCFLITDVTRDKLVHDAYHAIAEHEEFAVEPTVGRFDRSSPQSTFKAKFDDMRVSKKDQLRRDSVATRRYCLCFSVHLSASHGIELIGRKISLSFAILVGPKWDVEARLFLERSFADVRGALSETPAMVSYEDMANALEMKFQAIIETPQKSTTDNRPALINPRPLTNQAKHHLMLRLKPNSAAQVLTENFLKLSVAEEFNSKRGATEGEWKLVPFYEWFFKLAEIINKHLYGLWTEGLIYGYCGKDESEYLLRMCSRSVLLIRFSDIEYGKIKVSVRHRNGEIRHHWYDEKELSARDLKTELLTNSRFANVELIYPDVPLESALGGRQPKEALRKPRNFQPSPVYFDNQDAATANY